MPVNKVRRLGSFAPLSAKAYKDDALAAAGRDAECLFYRGLSFAADVIEDGFITDAQLCRLLGWDMKDAKRHADRLVDVGLWTRGEGGYWIRSWLKWNRSKAEIEGLRRKDAGRKAPAAKVPNGDDEPPTPESNRNPNGGQPESNSDMCATPNGFHAPEPEPYTEPEPTPEKSSLRSPSPRKRGSRIADDFAATPEMVEWARQRVPHVDGRAETEKFINYWQAKSGSGATKLDWVATWRNWMLNAGERTPKLRAVSNGYQPWTNPADHAAYDEELLP